MVCARLPTLCRDQVRSQSGPRCAPMADSLGGASSGRLWHTIIVVFNQLRRQVFVEQALRHALMPPCTAAKNLLLPFQEDSFQLSLTSRGRPAFVLGQGLLVDSDYVCLSQHWPSSKSQQSSAAGHTKQFFWEHPVLDAT